MFFRGGFIVFLAALCATAQPAKAPAVRVREIVDLLLTEKYTELIETFTPEVKKGLTLAVLRDQVGPNLKQLGAPQSFGTPTVEKTGQFSVVVLPGHFAAASVNFRITLNETGQVAGIYFQPGERPATAWTPPAYAKPDAFQVREVIVGEGEWKLPGTLTIPNGKGPFPAIVLVHGSGPNDRDERIGPNRPFQDLAEGISSRGIAVLRYDKRTKVHGARMAAMKNLTVQEESVDDAVLAATLLRKQPEIDPKRVFVLGHSLGGHLAPRIAKQDGHLAGLVILAGNTRSLEDAVIEQSEYIVSLQPQVSEAQRTQLEELRAVVEKIKRLKPGEDAGEPLLGMWPPYILDLRAYDPVATAKQLALPVLILQGERDYQVTMKEFAVWKAGLAERKNASFRAFPTLNHLFMAGEGKSNPVEYQKTGHVAAEVIDEIAKWIHREN